ncbi:MAG TPA: NAD(P)H-binding protein [Actinomycetales bacterium]|nr:NAD(P)H-binding protein [Actinomycetales bacterium]
MILVAGGTGLLGRRIVTGLSDRDQQVRAMSRGLAPGARDLPSGVEVVRGDVRDSDAVARAVAGANVVVSAVQGFAGPDVSPAGVDRDGNINLFDAAKSAGADVVLMSVIGAAADSPMELLRMKWQAEEALRDSGLRWTIVRSAAFAQTWIQLMRETEGRSGRPLVFGRGDNPMPFVDVADVAEVVVRAAVDESLRGHVLEVCGPEPVSLVQLAELVMRHAGRDRRPRHVPRAALHAMAWTVGRVRPQMGRQAEAALAMDDMAFPLDVAAAREALISLPALVDLPTFTPVSQVVSRPAS